MVSENPEPIEVHVPASWYMGADGAAHPAVGNQALWATLLLHPDGTVTWDVPDEGDSGE